MTYWLLRTNKSQNFPHCDVFVKILEVNVIYGGVCGVFPHMLGTILTVGIIEVAVVGWPEEETSGWPDNQSKQELQPLQKDSNSTTCCSRVLLHQVS